MFTTHNGYTIPFWISSDYFKNVLNNDPLLINSFPELQRKRQEINSDHSDLHVYPYTTALPAILSMGCNNTCSFCPTAHAFEGNIFFGDPEIILPNYENGNVHFLDENFFYNDMDRILPLLKRYNIKWLAMAHFDDVMRIYDRYGEDYLYDCGLRVLEIGLENISLMRKVKGKGVSNKKVEIFYLNLTFLPGETKESIRETTEWMKTHNIRNPILTYNGLWFSPGQYYYPYDEIRTDGIMLSSKLARVTPTYIPDSFLEQEICIEEIDLVNRYVHFIYSKDYIFYPKKRSYQIREFIEDDYKKALWLAVGIRVDAIL